MSEKDMDIRLIAIFAVAVLAVVVVSIAIGLFFGAKWGFALFAVSVVVFAFRSIRSTKKEIRAELTKEVGDEA